MVERQTDWHVLVFGVIASVVMLSLVFLAGYGLNQMQMDDLRTQIESSEVDQRSSVLGFELIRQDGESHCQELEKWMNESEEQMEDLRVRVADYEDSDRMELDRYEVLKKRYMNLVVQFYLENQEYSERCGDQGVDILYFYSNEECPNCEDQGPILTETAQANDDVTVYPLDTDLEMRHINLLQNRYEIDDYPAMVFNEEVYEGFMTMGEVSEAVEQAREDHQNS